MASRIEKENEQRRTDVERVARKEDQKSRNMERSEQSREKFKELIKKGQTAGAEQKRAEKKTEGDKSKVAHHARMARGGVLRNGRLMHQVKTFGEELQTQRKKTETSQKEGVETRAAGFEEARVADGDRVQEVEETEKETEIHKDEKQTEELKEQSRFNAAVDGSDRKQKRGDGGAGGNQNQERQQAEAQAVGGAVAAHEVKQIPEEILKALAREVFIGVNEKGLAEFRIELKEGILQGATMKVSADKDGRISLVFDGLSGHAKNLVKASHTELAGRLREKGLDLKELKA